MIRQLIFAGVVVLVGLLAACRGPHDDSPSSTPTTRAADMPQVAFPPELVATDVVESSSDALVKKTLAAIAANRAKLRTLYVEGANDWPDSRTAFAGKIGPHLEGKAWLEAAEPRRIHLNIPLHRMSWFGGARPFNEESYVEVWDGEKLRRQYGPPHCDPRGDIGPKRILLGGQIVGTEYSVQLLRDEYGSGRSDDPLDPRTLKYMVLTARRVILPGKQKAIELVVRFPRGLFTVKRTDTFWLDPDRGYGLLGRVWVDDGGLTRQYVIFDMAEAAPGIFYPTKAASTFTMKGSILSVSNFVATKVIANDPIPPGTLKLVFPAGLDVSEQGPAGSQPASVR